LEKTCVAEALWWNVHIENWKQDGDLNGRLMAEVPERSDGTQVE
jgi:hypothetical protein